MPIVDHYITDKVVDSICDDMMRAIGARTASDASARSAGLLSQRAIIEHYFERLDALDQARAIRTVAWIDAQVARLPGTVYADRYLSVGDPRLLRNTEPYTTLHRSM